jgi:hypothetical protein
MILQNFDQFLLISDEDGVNNCNDFSTAVNFDSQESSKEESNLEFQIFDSEEESIESETEIFTGCVNILINVLMCIRIFRLFIIVVCKFYNFHWKA